MAGRMFLMAWGRMTLVMAILLLIPRLRQASICPFGTAVIPERTTSATYAPEFNPNATDAISTPLSDDANTTEHHVVDQQQLDHHRRSAYHGDVHVAYRVQYPQLSGHVMGAAHHGDHGTDDQTDDQGNDRDYEGVLQTFEDVQVTVVLQEVRVEPVLELLPPTDVLGLLIRVARIAAPLSSLAASPL